MSGGLDRKGIEALIPHRDPFLLIDRVTELEPGVRCVAEHTFTGEEWYLKGHFPGNPIVPGVILTESMAQCVPMDAEILTRDGFRRADEVAVGHDVLAYDVTADECKWTQLRAISAYESQPTALLESRSFRFLCTSKHTWPVRLNRLPIQRTLAETDRLSALGRHAGNSIVVAAPAEGGSSELTPDEAEILGWVVTDGWIQTTGQQVRLTITQSKPEHLERIRQLVGADAREYVTAGGPRTFPHGRTYMTLDAHRFGLSSAVGRRLFERAGIRGRSDLPALASRLSKPARAAMLRAMLNAEGHRRASPVGRTGRTVVFGQENPYVREAFQILCALEGRALGRPQNGPEPGFVRQTVRANRMVDLKHLRISAGPVTDVWCPTTDYGTWVMRWKGAVTITGNTATVGAMALPEFREGIGLFAGIEEMKFKRIVRPGDTGRFTAMFVKMGRGFARVHVTAHVGDELAAEGTILALFQPTEKVKAP